MLFGGSDYRYNKKCIFFSFNERRESRPGTHFPKVPVTFHGSKSKSGHPSLQTSSFCLVNGSVNHVVFKSFEKDILNVNNSFTGPLITGLSKNRSQFCYRLHTYGSLLCFSLCPYNACRIECEFIRLFLFPPILLLSSYHMPPPSPTSEKSYNLGRSWLITLET